MYHYIEKWEQDLDQGKKVCTMFTNLTNVFDTVHHNLLFAKLKKSYLLKRFQRVNINNKFGEQCKSILEIITRVNSRFHFVQYFH